MDDRGVRHVLGRGGPVFDVLVLYPDAREPQPHEVEDVGHSGVFRQEARAAGERRGALGGQLLGLFDPGWTVVAANAPREQCLFPWNSRRF